MEKNPYKKNKKWRRMKTTSEEKRAKKFCVLSQFFPSLMFTISFSPIGPFL
jgi:hypothetical protein